MFFGMQYDEVFNNDATFQCGMKYSRKDLFIDDLYRVTLNENPKILPTFDLVFVLSGRGTALKNDADGLNREFDISDDISRLKEGVRIAKKINSLKLNKPINKISKNDYSVRILYNGREIQNSDLRKAIQDKLIDYPINLFDIVDFDNKVDTVNQINFLNDYLPNKDISNIAVVSSAYHLPRVARSFHKVLNCNKDLKVYLYGVHKQEKHPGIIHDIRGEWSAMVNYSSEKQGAVSKISKHIHDNIVICKNYTLDLSL